VVLGLVLGRWLSWLGLAFALFCLFFFRDPERVAPGRPGAILAPADGRVASIAPGVPPAELGLGSAPRWRVSIFLSILNVHVNRVPVDGTVTRVAYRHGAFVNASLDKASEGNERNAIALRLHDGREIAVVQIAGLVARRILCSIREGDAVHAGDRFGMIRFGSRTDLYLPEGVRPLIAEGQTMVGGETVIAELAL
jgi:phosphatidylserine decarboxylase